MSTKAIESYANVFIKVTLGVVHLASVDLMCSKEARYICTDFLPVGIH